METPDRRYDRRRIRPRWQLAWYRKIVLSGFVRPRWPIWRVRIRGATGPGELVTGSCAGSRAGSCTLLTWRSVLVWHVDSRGQPAALHLDCPGQGGEVRARWPRSGTGDIPADR